ncbi:MAG TPA: C1 family peptidase [Methylomirabilota bacterium]|nr:C1 family peptidase [Methylomirabilota bacterium]
MSAFDHRRFQCPDNDWNRQQHADLDYLKANGWRVVDAAKDATDANVMIITLDGGAASSSADAPPATAKRARGVVKPARPGAGGPTLEVGGKSFALIARPDAVDFRDKMYEPTLVEVPTEWPLERHLKSWSRSRPPVLDQGREGACTGFGLAAVAHFLLTRRKVHPDKTRVSARMFYEMAQRYDEWEGEDYSGSSARGAMKGWHKHGVCSDRLWPYAADPAQEGTLTPERAFDALQRPLGAYFRVNHRDLVAMHSALAEVGILYATAFVHEGWANVRGNGVIERHPTRTGGHAFAIVGYDAHGFWLQNSWGTDWGRGGFARVSYDDWMENGTDVWVARLGAPVLPPRQVRRVPAGDAGPSAEVRRARLQQHTVALGNDGRLRRSGEVGNTEDDVRRILKAGGDFETTSRGWTRPRLLLYAHGGLVAERDALQRVAEYLPALIRNEVYPLAFIWKTDLWSTLGNLLRDAVSRRRPEGALDTAKDFLLDRLDDTLELVARPAGQPIWSEMKENAQLATDRGDGGARLVLALVRELLERRPEVEIHLAAHSAGSILIGRFVRDFCARAGRVCSLTLWAPACSLDFFRENYLPALEAGRIARFGLYTLKDGAERDDHCANIYHKSLLYLVAHALEARARWPGGNGTPLLGMEKFILNAAALFGVDPEAVRHANPHVVPLRFGPDSHWIRSPNGLQPDEDNASTARRHGDFDDDTATVQSTLRRILGGAAPTPVPLPFKTTPSGLNSRRQALDKAAPPR